MSRRKGSSNGFTLCVNLRAGADVRRFCQVHVSQNDDVYVLQPRKGKSVKVSYHESGQRHVKIGQGPPMFVMRLDKPEWILQEERVWSQSFENFKDLLPYRGEPANAVFEIDLPTTPHLNAITFAQVSIGQFFDPEGWSMDEVVQNTLKQQVFRVAIFASQVVFWVSGICLALSRHHWRTSKTIKAANGPPRELTRNAERSVFLPCSRVREQTHR